MKTKEILETAAARADEAARGRHVLILQDTTEINYQAKAERKRHLGKVGNGEDIGLFAHPALIVDAADGMVLGLAGAKIWRRKKVKAKNYQQLPIEKKESFRWLDTAMTARKRLSGAAMATVIGDREADIYELFARVPDARTHVLIRAEHNRALAAPRRRKGGKDDEGEQVLRLFDALSAQPEAGRIRFELEGRPGRTKRTVTLAVRYATVALRKPAKGANRRDPKSVTLQAIEAREVDAPSGEEPILWRLLTTHPIAWFEDAVRLIDLYRLRWLIEQLFRTLKSRGLDIEDSLLAEGRALENFAATTLIAATHVMQLVQGRGEKGEARKASLVFTAAEVVVIKAVVKKFEGQTLKQKNLYRPGSLAWAAWAIARLGGWKGYATERPPGPITFANGLKRFHAICEGYDLATLRSS